MDQLFCDSIFWQRLSQARCFLKNNSKKAGYSFCASLINNRGPIGLAAVHESANRPFRASFLERSSCTLQIDKWFMQTCPHPAVLVLAPCLFRPCRTIRLECYAGHLLAKSPIHGPLASS
jgi:hypothetical protein